MQDAKSPCAQQEAQELYRSWKSLCDDNNLYSIAQLATYRLRAQRAIIALIDDDDLQQIHILAEATQNLRFPQKASPGHGLILDVTSVPLSSILCDRQLFEDSTASLKNVRSERPDHFASTNCETDDRFKDHAFVKKEGGVRFAAGVPLMSKNDNRIGVLIVLDESPKSFENTQLAELKDCAQCVVKHLELARSSIEHSQGSKILREIAGCFADQYHHLPGNGEDETSEATMDTESGEGEQYGQAIIKPVLEGHADVRKSRKSIEFSLKATFDSAASILRDSTRANGIVILGSPAVASLIAGDDDTSPHESDGDEAASIVLASCLQNGDTFPAMESQHVPSMGTLHRLASAYARGKIFDLSSDGRNGHSSESDNQQTSRTMPIDHVNHDKPEKEELPAALREELFTHLGNPQMLICLPVYDQETSALLATCLVWNDFGHPATNAYQAIEDYHILGNYLSHTIAQLRIQNGDAEQRKLMSNFSHELRTPINGILGAAQFMQDTVSDNYQNELLQSIVVSSNTLLDTLNIVLDYTKFEHSISDTKELDVGEKSSSTLPTPAQSFYFKADVDLALLVEDATETVVAGHFFDNLPPGPERPGSTPRPHDDYRAGQGIDRGTTQDVKVVLKFSTTPTWNVKTSPGAISRIIMNLVGNALKFTPTGIIVVELDPQRDEDASKINVRLKVTDSGIGMTEHFMKHHLFTPYRQGNPFSPGVGLGMSVLKHMVSSLDGDLSISSKLGEGTAVTVDLKLAASGRSLGGVPEDIKSILSRIKGKHLVLLDPKAYDRVPTDSVVQRGIAIERIATDWLGMKVSTSSDIDVADADFYLFCEPPPVEDILKQHQKAAKNNSVNMEVPLVIVATDSREAHMINLGHAVSLEETGRIVQVLSQPCGPRKLAKVLNLCQDRAEQSKKDRASKERVNGTAAGHKPSESEPRTNRDQYGSAIDGQSVANLRTPPSVSEEKRPPKKISRLPSNNAAEDEDQPNNKSQRHTQSNDQNGDEVSEDGANDQVAEPQETQLPFSKPLVLSRAPADVAKAKRHDPERKSLHGLCVDDNKINLRLLVTLMRKEKHTYEQSENGQEALDAFVASNGVDSPSDDSRRPFDFVLMDIGMPVMNGIQCTKAIREYERKHNLAPTYIVACTAWGDMQTQREAKEAGMDAFLPKPLKFAHLKNLLAVLLRHE